MPKLSVTTTPNPHLEKTDPAGLRVVRPNQERIHTGVTELPDQGSAGLIVIVFIAMLVELGLALGYLFLRGVR